MRERDAGPARVVRLRYRSLQSIVAVGNVWRSPPFGMAEPPERGGRRRPRAGIFRLPGPGQAPSGEREEARVRRGNGSRLDADLLTGGEIELLMRRCSRRAPTGVRNRALIAVLWRCGLRLGEALALAAKDFDPDAGTLVVQRGKGGKRRVVGVDAGTVALVGRWLELRRKRGIAGGPLFCTLAGRADGPVLRAPPAAEARAQGRHRAPGARARAPARVRGRPRPLGGAALRRPRRARPLVAWRPPRCTSPGSARTRRSTRCGTASGRCSA